MKIAQMREFIANEYPGQTWKEKVKRMPPNQVIAIYHSIQQRAAKKALQTPQVRDQEGYQFTIWDYI